jgi:hypothetical protein
MFSPPARVETNSLLRYIQVVGQAVSLTEGEFNQFLDPPAYLRTDFPDSIGNNTFTYADRNDASKKTLLAKFVQESMALYQNGSTSSGVSYSQLTAFELYGLLSALSMAALLTLLGMKHRRNKA